MTPSLEKLSRKPGAIAHKAESYEFTVLFEPAQDESGYIVTCPALPGVATEGETLDEAREMAKDAIQLYLESLREDGVSIPHDVQPVREKIAVALA
jgi:antitoxin HicB